MEIEARASTRLAGKFHAAAAAELDNLQSWLGSASRKRSAIGAAKIEDRHLIATDPAPEPGSVHQILKSDKRIDSNALQRCRQLPIQTKEAHIHDDMGMSRHKVSSPRPSL
jgi:hypothetical protein